MERLLYKTSVHLAKTMDATYVMRAAQRKRCKWKQQPLPEDFSNALWTEKNYIDAGKSLSLLNVDGEDAAFSEEMKDENAAARYLETCDDESPTTTMRVTLEYSRGRGAAKSMSTSTRRIQLQKCEKQEEEQTTLTRATKQGTPLPPAGTPRSSGTWAWRARGMTYTLELKPLRFGCGRENREGAAAPPPCPSEADLEKEGDRDRITIQVDRIHHFYIVEGDTAVVLKERQQQARRRKQSGRKSSFTSWFSSKDTDRMYKLMFSVPEHALKFLGALRRLMMLGNFVELVVDRFLNFIMFAQPRGPGRAKSSSSRPDQCTI